MSDLHDIAGITAELNRLAVATEEAVRKTPGSTDRSLRDSIRAHARGETTELEPAIARVVDQIREEPAAADLDSLLQSGHSDDEVFEMVLVAAMTEGMTRLERATALMAATKPTEGES